MINLWGVYSGAQLEKDKDFLFSTVQTISKQSHLDKFDKDYFDYIIIDESHRSGSNSYKRLLDYFQPKFLLGMTATPERTDGEDIFNLFDHNIAYEIRLNRAMEENMLSNFHYYGVTDLTIEDKEQEAIRDFAYLSSDERVKHIVKYANFYGSDNGITRGLVFCSSNDESKKLAEMFNQSGLRSRTLSGESSEGERNEAIKLLESDNLAEKLDYIFTVDIFNEGIDIPKVNQIIMIRPTESAIIFVQQLGRGLRKVDGKSYLTVIDFIGNYSNNYLIPIALYGDTSYNKDSLRRSISSGSTLIPGSSSINFDQITKESIFESIDSANMGLLKDLKKDYDLLKYKLGRIPMMMDFIQHGSRDPYLYVEYSKSYHCFICKVEKSTGYNINEEQKTLLTQFALNINNAKRVEECIIMKELITKSFLELNNFKNIIKTIYGYSVSDETIESCLINLNFKFIKKESSIIEYENDKFKLSPAFNQHLKNSNFKAFLIDNIEYSIHTYNKRFELKKYINGFQLYGKYTRKDVCRILNWEQNYDSTVYGYKIHRDEAPLFVTYRKSGDISLTTQYNDHFISQDKFAWESKAGRKLDSKDVIAIRDAAKTDLTVSLFIQKSNNEGADFYFMGYVDTVVESLTQEYKINDKNKNVPVVHMEFILQDTVQESLYRYLTNQEIIEQKSKPTALKLVSPKPTVEMTDEKEKNLIPLYDFYAAAGSFSEMQENKEFEMISVPQKYALDNKYFCCRVKGESMNRRIKNNSICIFRESLGGSRNGKIVLVENYGHYDEEYNSSFTVKTYASEKITTDDGEWKHSVILLKPNSTESRFEDIVLHEDDCENMRIVGEFVAVLD